MAKNLSVDLEIRLYEQLQELAENYGIENVLKIADQVASGMHVETEKVQAGPNIKSQHIIEDPKKPMYREEIEKDKVAEQAAPKPQMPPNIKNIEEFVKQASLFQRDKVREYILTKLKYFIDNARLVEAGDIKKVGLDFVMSLTDKQLFGDVITPEEDWLEYNFNILRKEIKKKLSLFGYVFLDSDGEVGKLYDESKHNCVGTEPVDTSFKDKRVLKVVNEGLIIARVIHVNANVILGKYVAS